MINEAIFGVISGSEIYADGLLSKWYIQSWNSYPIVFYILSFAYALFGHFIYFL